MQFTGSPDIVSRAETIPSASAPALEIPEQAVYLDSPVLSALRQIEPFYHSGMFGAQETPLLLRVKPLMGAQLMAAGQPSGIDLRRLRRGQSSRLPVAAGGVVFYPFNSQSNMNAVTNRAVTHVLTLHGESNKLASMRPAARLYDYICVAGPLAIDRYLSHGIFTRADVDSGRLVMMGDSFVQTLPWARAEKTGEAGALLYCPTWEGYGNGPVNYSSVAHQRGFEMLKQIAKASGVDRIIVKPHPYLGMLKPHLLFDFIAGVRNLAKSGPKVDLALGDSSLPLRVLCRTHLRHVGRINEAEAEPQPVRLGLCDISGTEAVFLKQGIPSMILSSTKEHPASVSDIYSKKALSPDKKDPAKVAAYLEAAHEIDQAHRQLVFGWQEPTLSQMTHAMRRSWLIDYVRRDPFWGRNGTLKKEHVLDKIHIKSPAQDSIIEKVKTL
jgi:hypothetical protein